MARPIHSIPEGAEFTLAALPNKRGTLIRLGSGSAVVRYHGLRDASFEAHMPGEVVAVAFSAPLRTTTISLGTEVEVAHG